MTTQYFQLRSQGFSFSKLEKRRITGKEVAVFQPVCSLSKDGQSLDISTRYHLWMSVFSMLSTVIKPEDYIKYTHPLVISSNNTQGCGHTHTQLVFCRIVFCRIVILCVCVWPILGARAWKSPVVVTSRQITVVTVFLLIKRRVPARLYICKT